MGAPTVYRWDDANAPVAHGLGGTSLIAILKACLVDGYGEKAAAGWTMPFVNAAGTKAAFRNNENTGTGFYLQVDNTPTLNGLAVQLMGYESMSDVDTGVTPFSSARLCGTSSTATSTARPWMIIADDRFFYYWCWYSTATTVDLATTTPYIAAGFCFGDCIALDPDDNYFCILAGNDASWWRNTTFYLSASTTATTSHQVVARNIAGDNKDTLFALIDAGGPHVFTGYGVSLGIASGRVAGAEVISRPYVNNGVIRSIRGYYPGYWTVSIGSTEVTCFETLERNGLNLLLINYIANTTNVQVAIDISENFRP